MKYSSNLGVRFPKTTMVASSVTPIEFNGANDAFGKHTPGPLNWLNVKKNINNNI